jgi:hypothetical protein
MKIIYFFLFLFSYNTIFCQSFCIADSLTKKAIPFSNIKFFNSNNFTIGNYSDENGIVNYSNVIFDKLEISHISYKTINLEKKQISDTIFLNQNSIILNEIIVVNSKKEIITLGYIQNKQKTNLTAYKGIEIVVYLDNPTKQPKIINSFLFKMKKNGNNKTAVRIHIYKKKNNDLVPSEEITNVEILHFIDKKSKELVEIDIKDYSIEFPSDGAFVGIEWLGNFDFTANDNNNYISNQNELYIELNDKINQPLTFIRSKLTDELWENTEKLKLEFKDIIEYKNLPNASFGIKLLN